jgi:uncharacterized membrane protein
MVFGVMSAATNSAAIGMLTMLLYVAWIVGLLGICIFLMVKAYGGSMFKLPVIGDMADKWSN